MRAACGRAPAQAEEGVLTVWLHLAVHVARALTKAHSGASAGAASGAVGSTSNPRAIWRARRRTKSSAVHAPAPLLVDVRREPTTGARDLRLRANGGEAWVVLCDPAPDAADPAARHDAVIEAKDRRRGASLLAAVAWWLGVKAPAPLRAHPLRPLALQWSRVASAGDFERVVLHFAWNGRAADVLLELRTSAPTGRLVEKDPAMRADLVAILAVALRDGAPA